MGYEQKSGWGGHEGHDLNVAEYTVRPMDGTGFHLGKIQSKRFETVAPHLTTEKCPTAKTDNEVQTSILYRSGGPLPVVNGVLNPINGLING